MSDAAVSGNSEPREIRVPFCLTWASDIPSIAGPYGPGWEAHNACPASKHGWFVYEVSPDAILLTTDDS